MSRYGPEYWDKYGSYRTPLAFHLSILVLLRAYFIWVIAALSRRPELDLMSLFFKSKDDNGLPVSLQIRDTLNGYPAQTILPFSDVSLLPTQVNISEDAATATKFTFPSLVYLQPGEYAMVVLSNSLKYEAYISEMGENIIGTSRKISEQPYAGVLFKSQNASTWSPDQNQDLTFKINRANFTINATAEAVFEDGTSAAEYKADIIQIVPAEVVINNTSIGWGVKLTPIGSTTLDTTFANIIKNTNCCIGFSES